jgi:hypothetical protein
MKESTHFCILYTFSGRHTYSEEDAEDAKATADATMISIEEILAGYE